MRNCGDGISGLYLWGSEESALEEGKMNIGRAWDVRWNEKVHPGRGVQMLAGGWNGEPLGALSKDGLLGKKGCCEQPGNGEQHAGRGASSLGTVEPMGSEASQVPGRDWASSS